MKLNRKRYQEIRKYDHGQMDSFVEDVKKVERERIIRAYQEALENVQGIGQKRREEVQNKVNEILRKGE